MRRAEIIRGIDELADALQSSSVEERLGTVRRFPLKESLPQEFVGQVLIALQRYSIDAEKFSEAGAKIENIFGLQLLRHAPTWSRLLAPGDQAREARMLALELLNTVSFAKEYLQSFVLCLCRKRFSR